MRVTIVTDSFPPVVNGVSSVTSWLAVNLVEYYGYDVTVITAGKKSFFEFFNNKLKIIRIPSYPESAYKIPLIGVDHALRELLADSFGKADLVHAHNIHGVFTPLLVELYRPRTLIFQPHYGGKFFRSISNILAGAYRGIARKIASISSGHVVVSAYEKVVYSNYLKSRVEGTVIPNPIPRDTKKYSWDPPEELTITYAGRLDFYKHPEVLLYVAEIILKKYNIKVKVKYVGDGPARKLVERLARRVSGVNVALLGKLKRDKYLSEIASSTVLVLPSEGEAYGIVVGEALSIGVPVVATRPWGIIWKYYCPSRVRLVRDYRDLSGIAESILSFYNYDHFKYNRECAIPSEKEILGMYVNYYDKILS